MNEARPRDPFGLTADTALYVPRPATERALDALRTAVEQGGRTVALTGPTGLGKTLLLHVLAERIRERWRPVFLPYPALSPSDLSTWVLSVLGDDHAGPLADPPESEAGTVRANQPHAAQTASRELSEEPPERGSERQLVLVDDAGSLPVETARWLRSLVANGTGQIALVVAASDRAVASARLAALGDSITVRLTEPMADDETLEHVRQRLVLADAPVDVRGRFDDATLRRLHAISGGNPRRLHIAAADLLAGGSGRIPEDELASAHEPAEAAPAPLPGIEED